jgi:hypothetical protein
VKVLEDGPPDVMQDAFGLHEEGMEEEEQEEEMEVMMVKMVKVVKMAEVRKVTVKKAAG